MPSPSTSPSNVIEVVFCRTKCDKLAVIHENYYFHHNRKYKGGDYWCCAQRGCKVRLISTRVDHGSGRMEFSRRNKAIEHQHGPNAPNLIEKEFRRQLAIQIEKITFNESGSSNRSSADKESVQKAYNQLRKQAIERGVPGTLIPAFFNIRSTAYRLHRKNKLTYVPSSDSETERKETQGASAGEGSATATSSDPESPSSSTMGEPSTSPVQSEPLSLVTWKAQEEPLQLQVRRDLVHPYTSPILYQSLQPNSSSSTTPPISQQQTTQFETSPLITPMPPIDPNILRYSSYLFSNYSPYSPTLAPTPAPTLAPTLPYPAPEFMQYYAALHTEYLRSFMAFGSYPRM